MSTGLAATLARTTAARTVTELWQATWDHLDEAPGLIIGGGDVVAAFHHTAVTVAADTTDPGETATTLLMWAGDLAVHDPAMAALIVRSSASVLRARLHELEALT